MNAYELIVKKRSGEELDREQIEFLIGGFLSGDVANYQVSAFLMAAYFNGMTDRETEDLTRIMLNSGTILDFSDVPGYKVDKHSTGGVGDKLSLIVAPLAAAAGVKVPMISGRGLGHTGGTLDKLESIPGMSTSLTPDQFRSVVSRVGMAIVGQSPDVVPADQKLYALRDVTGTIESVPFIVSSILSKKLAAGLDGLVLDVKVGGGAFMGDLGSARRLARQLISTGRALGLEVTALITDMESPLGRTVGNALEVREAIDVLRGGGPSDVRELSIELAARMLLLGRIADDLTACLDEVTDALSDGRGLEVFSRFVDAQGGNAGVVDSPELLPRASIVSEVVARESGYVNAIDAREIGLASVSLGAGRSSLGEAVDPAVGIEIAASVGTPVERGTVIALVHANDEEHAVRGVERVGRAFRIGPSAPGKRGVVVGEENG